MVLLWGGVPSGTGLMRRGGSVKTKVHGDGSILVAVRSSCTPAGVSQSVKKLETSPLESDSVSHSEDDVVAGGARHVRQGFFEDDSVSP